MVKHRIQKAKTIAELRRVCKPMPLDNSELEVFYVETDAARDPHQQTRNRLKAGLETEPARVLFYGHPGCGKSTELNKFLKENSGQFFPVKFSVTEEMTPSNVLAEDLILVITEKVLNAAKDADLSVSDKALKGVYEYFAENTKVTRGSREGTLTAGGGVDASGGYLGKLIGLFVNFHGEIKLNSYSEETSVSRLRKRPADLLGQANIILDVVRKKIPDDKRLLVIVEDIDKLDLKQAREIYVNNVNLLTGLTTDVIYTIPIYLFYSPESSAFEARFDDVIGLPMIKVLDPEILQGPPGVNIVKDIVYRRIERDLIESDALNLLVEKTGGVLRHVFKVLYIVSTMEKVDNPITSENIRYGLDQLRNELWQQIALPLDGVSNGLKSVNELFDRLAEYAKKQFKGEKQIPVSDLTNQILLKCCALVEYNGKRWVGVHPLVIENLETLGRLKHHG